MSRTLILAAALSAQMMPTHAQEANSRVPGLERLEDLITDSREECIYQAFDMAAQTAHALINRGELDYTLEIMEPVQDNGVEYDAIEYTASAIENDIRYDFMIALRANDFEVLPLFTFAGLSDVSAEDIAALSASGNPARFDNDQSLALLEVTITLDQELSSAAEACFPDLEAAMADPIAPVEIMSVP